MSGITYWNRLEPDPRTDDLSRALRAELRDPLWLLTRQWQVGEFKGEDAGSPAFVEVLYRNETLARWSANGHEGAVDIRGAPIELQLGGESFDGTGLAMRVELGHVFEDLLEDVDGDGTLRTIFRAAFPLPSETPVDPSARRFMSICRGRAVDGYALLSAARRTRDGTLDLDTDDRAASRRAAPAVRAFVETVRRVYGEPGAREPAGLAPHRLELAGEVESTGTSPMTLRAHMSPSGDLDWYAFDALRVPVEAFRGAVQSLVVAPQHVYFRGMPNHRFWDFEDGTVDFGAIRADTRDLSRLTLVEFMLVASNDWFALPVKVPAGSATRIEAVLVHDVFGGITYVPRTDADAREGEDRWSMFAATDVGTGLPTDVFVMPSALALARQAGPTLEEVRYLRDEMANMVWAVESTRTTALGEPDSSRGGVVADPGTPGIAARTSTAAGTGPATGTALSYRVGLPAPERWIPFLAMREADGSVWLRRAALLDVGDGHGEPQVREATTRLLGAGLANAAGTRLYEEEVPRAGVCVRRVVHRARGVDGATYSWVERVRSIGLGEGNSGLRWDVVLEEAVGSAAATAATSEGAPATDAADTSTVP